MHVEKACQSVSIDLYLCKYETIETALSRLDTDVWRIVCPHECECRLLCQYAAIIMNVLVALFAKWNRCNTSLNNAQSHFALFIASKLSCPLLLCFTLLCFVLFCTEWMLFYARRNFISICLIINIQFRISCIFAAVIANYSITVFVTWAQSSAIWIHMEHCATNCITYWAVTKSYLICDFEKQGNKVKSWKRW